MPVKKLKIYLDDNQIKYVSIKHSPAYTAQEIAQVAHVSGEQLAKTVIVKANGVMTMLVIPATKKIDFDLLKRKYFVDAEVELAAEEEFCNKFPDCELGAMPPFGNLYNMKVLIANSLMALPELIFNAGSHLELIKLSSKDFSKLVKPIVIEEM